MVLYDAFEEWLKDGNYQALYMRLKFAGGNPVEFMGKNVPHVGIQVTDGYGTIEYSSRAGRVCEHCRQKTATEMIKVVTRIMMHSDVELQTTDIGTFLCKPCKDKRDEYVSAIQNDGMDDLDDPITGD